MFKQEEKKCSECKVPLVEGTCPNCGKTEANQSESALSPEKNKIKNNSKGRPREKGSMLFGIIIGAIILISIAAALLFRYIPALSFLPVKTLHQIYPTSYDTTDYYIQNFLKGADADAATENVSSSIFCSQKTYEGENGKDSNTIVVYNGSKYYFSGNINIIQSNGARSQLNVNLIAPGMSKVFKNDNTTSVAIKTLDGKFYSSHLPTLGFDFRVDDTGTNEKSGNAFYKLSIASSHLNDADVTSVAKYFYTMHIISEAIQTPVEINVYNDASDMQNADYFVLMDFSKKGFTIENVNSSTEGTFVQMP